jgi:tetratricopeptide (TPR) repeat protein
MCERASTMMRCCPEVEVLNTILDVTTPQAAIDAGLKLHSAGDLIGAERIYREILKKTPDFPPALHLLGVAVSQQGRKTDAVELISQAIQFAPNVPDFHANLALALLESGDPQRSIAAAQRAIALQPHHSEAHNILGNAFKGAGQIDASVPAYQRVLQLRPDHPDARHNLADSLVRLGRRAEADEVIRQALLLNPNDLKSLLARGHMLLRQRNFIEAEGLFRSLLAAYPKSPEVHDGLATALMEQSRFADAAELYQRAIELDPAHPGPHSNLGFALVSLNRVEEGIASYHRALERRPDLPDTYNNLGNAHLARLDLIASLAAYNRSLYFKPDHTDAHWNRSLLLLLMGNFDQGFAEYEWRWLRFPDQRRPFTQPLWDGSEIPGRAILLHAEQGLGDTIQFCRLAGQVAERTSAAAVHLEVQGELLSLMQSLPSVVSGQVKLLARGQALPAFDFHCPLMSLPHALALRVDTIPAEAPYVAADDELARKFAGLIGPSEAAGLNVGLVWAGAPIHRRDRERSIPFAMLAPLLALPGVRFVSLQKPRPLAAIGSVLDLSCELTDFAHTAAAIENLDLVITIDTSVAHLAGAMGRRVWTLLPYSPDWRWLLGRDDSAWYPTMRLWRQDRAGEWGGVIERVALEMKRLMEQGGSMGLAQGR